MICEVENKRQYINEAAAHEARRATIINNIKAGKVSSGRKALNVYKCTSCGFYHVGHSYHFLMN